MKFYSEILNKMFDSVDELNEAEYNRKLKDEKKKKEAEKKEAEERARTDEVEQARIAFEEAKNNYYTLLNSYCRDYGFYTFTPDPVKSSSNFPHLSELARSLGIL